MQERLERQARNEDVMRSVNERMAALDKSSADWAGPDQQFQFQCECGTNGCDGRVLMTLGEYERVRRQRDRFAVVPGHEAEEIEAIVELDERFVIVDKRDEFEHLVE